MSEMGDFDPYYLWLQIPPSERPPSLYRLLGLADFESDPEVIDNAAEQRLMHLRSVQNGPHGGVAQALMTEISQARVTLLTPESRCDYDSLLKQKQKVKQSRARPGTASVETSSSSQPLITTSATNKRLSYAKGRKKSAWKWGLVFVIVMGSIAAALVYFVIRNRDKPVESTGTVAQDDLGEKKNPNSSRIQKAKSAKSSELGETPKLSAQERAALDKLRPQFQDIVQQLARREFNLAARSITKAKSAANFAAAQSLVTGIENVARDYQAFWTLLPERCDLLKATQQIDLEKTAAIVVSSSKEEIKLKLNGTTQTFSPQQLPPGMAMKIFEMTNATRNSAYYRIKAAVYFVHSNGNDVQQAKAVQCWNEAREQGLDIANYRALLSN